MDKLHWKSDIVLHLFIQRLPATFARRPAPVNRNCRLQRPKAISFITGILQPYDLQIKQKGPNAVAIAIITDAFHLNIETIKNCLDIWQVLVLRDLELLRDSDVGFVMLGEIAVRSDVIGCAQLKYVITDLET